MCLIKELTLHYVSHISHAIRVVCTLCSLNNRFCKFCGPVFLSYLTPTMLNFKFVHIPLFFRMNACFEVNVCCVQFCGSKFGATGVSKKFRRTIVHISDSEHHMQCFLTSQLCDERCWWWEGLPEPGQHTRNEHGLLLNSRCIFCIVLALRHFLGHSFWLAHFWRQWATADVCSVQWHTVLIEASEAAASTLCQIYHSLVKSMRVVNNIFVHCHSYLLSYGASRESSCSSCQVVLLGLF